MKIIVIPKIMPKYIPPGFASYFTMGIEVRKTP